MHFQACLFAPCIAWFFIGLCCAILIVLYVLCSEEHNLVCSMCFLGTKFLNLEIPTINIDSNAKNEQFIYLFKIKLVKP
jgi:hypothetical protein